MKGVMGSQYTAEWGVLLRLMTRDTSWSRVQTFTIKYIFQSIRSGVRETKEDMVKTLVLWRSWSEGLIKTYATSSQS